MNFTILFASFAAIAVTWYVVTTILIYETLRQRALKVNFLFLRFLAPKHASQYRDVTRKETGKTGPLFYHWIFSINAALISAIVVILSRSR